MTHVAKVDGPETFEQALADWILTRPSIIQEAARRWPIDTRVLGMPDDRPWFVFGWAETTASDQSNDPNDLMLIVTPIDPHEYYGLAMTHKEYVCARHCHST